MKKIPVRKHFRKTRSKVVVVRHHTRIPAKLGSRWTTPKGKYIHGPRQIDPKKCSKIRVGKPTDTGERNVFCKLKGEDKWALQSKLTPKKNYGAKEKGSGWKWIKSEPKENKRYEWKKIPLKEELNLDDITDYWEPTRREIRIFKQPHKRKGAEVEGITGEFKKGFLYTKKEGKIEPDTQRGRPTSLTYRPITGPYFMKKRVKPRGFAEELKGNEFKDLKKKQSEQLDELQKKKSRIYNKRFRLLHQVEQPRGDFIKPASPAQIVSLNKKYSGILRKREERKEELSKKLKTRWIKYRKSKR